MPYSTPCIFFLDLVYRTAVEPLELYPLTEYENCITPSFTLLNGLMTDSSDRRLI